MQLLSTETPGSVLSSCRFEADQMLVLSKCVQLTCTTRLWFSRFVCAMVNSGGCICAAGLLEEIPDADKWITDVLQSVT